MKNFFEADEYQALLDNLPEYLRPVIQTAYITGWRINSEILTRQKRHVDFDSGCLRFESSEANDEKAEFSVDRRIARGSDATARKKQQTLSKRPAEISPGCSTVTASR